MASRFVFDFKADCGAPFSSSQHRSSTTAVKNHNKMPPPIRTFHASCHCHSSTLSFTIPQSSLPLPVHFCHCTICRKTHGTLLSTHAPIPAPDADLNNFSCYKSSKSVMKWFCKTCGAHMLDRVNGEKWDKWYVAVSLVHVEEEEEKDVWRYTGHHFVESTRDGGLAILLRRIDGDTIALWNERPVEDQRFRKSGDWAQQSTLPDIDDVGEKAESDMLRVKCHCGSVQFSIARPSRTNNDILLPERVVTKDPSKLAGQHCACDSCRLVCSSFITSYISVAISALIRDDNSLNSENEVLGIGVTYKSSEGRSRTFCHICGSSVSFRSIYEPGIVWVAAGLVEGEGVRAEGWVEWNSVVHGMEDAVLKSVAKVFSDSLESMPSSAS